MAADAQNSRPRARVGNKLLDLPYWLAVVEKIGFDWKKGRAIKRRGKVDECSEMLRSWCSTVVFGKALPEKETRDFCGVKVELGLRDRRGWKRRDRAERRGCEKRG